MKVVELVFLSREVLKLLSENDVKTGDWKYLKMYDEFRHMRANGVKYRMAVVEVAQCHGISRSKAERIIKRLSKDIEETEDC